MYSDPNIKTHGADYLSEQTSLTMRDFITVWDKLLDSSACLIKEMYSDPNIRATD